MLTVLDEDWWNWLCLDALHVWTDFDCPEPPFQQLNLSFVVPQSRDAETIYMYYSLNARFEHKLSSIIKPDGSGTQVLAHIIKGHVLCHLCLRQPQCGLVGKPQYKAAQYW